jgi:hypothetical protein
MRIRLSLGLLWGTLVVGGGLVAIAADRLSMPTVREWALLAVFLGAVVFGVEMIVTRRAEIATRYSSDVNPAFHVFRGWSAIAWGISIALFTSMLVGFGLIEITGWTTAREFFAERPGIVIVLAGITIAAWGFGSAGKATYRYRTTEKPAPRLGDRIAGMLAIPLGLAIFVIGLLRSLAPSVLDAWKASLTDWLFKQIPR